MNIWQITGKIQISIQIVFWSLYIYLCNFDLIFECFQNSISQFIILLLFVFHQICALRNFYLGIYTSSEIKEKNDLIQNTFCKKCGKERPLRSHHCSICNKCIERMDHHCYFMNNCIGKKNYKYFFKYLLFSFINSSSGIILGCYRFYIFKYFELGNIRRSFKLRFYFGFLMKIFILEMICIPTFLGTGYLLIYHLFLVYKGETTIERIYPKLYIKDENFENKSFCERFLTLLEIDNLLKIYSFE